MAATPATIKKLKSLTNKICGDLQSKEVTIDHLTKVIEDYKEMKQDSDQQIEKMEKTNKDLEKELKQIKTVASNGSETLQMFTELLKEKYAYRDAEEDRFREMAEAHSDATEMAGVIKELYEGFSKMVEMGGHITQTKLQDAQAELVDKIATKLTDENIGDNADSLSKLFTEEKRRLQLKNRKFKPLKWHHVKHYMH